MLEGERGVLRKEFEKFLDWLAAAVSFDNHGNGIAGSTGNGYASFLLGQVDTATVNTVQDPELRRQAWGLFIQDTWKVTHKFTLDYGLRWDLQSWGHEIHYRWTEFGPNVPNPVDNNVLGAISYQGYGPGRCNCTFTKTYPYSIAPRLGAAYQLDSKTVLRAGGGISYAPISTFNYITNAAILGVGFNQLNFPSPAFGIPATTLSQGLVYNPSQLTTASLAPGLYSAASGTPRAAPFFIDPNAGRAARILQWSIGGERQVARDLVVEANFVGNRGADRGQPRRAVRRPTISQAIAADPARERTHGPVVGRGSAGDRGQCRRAGQLRRRE